MDLNALADLASLGDVFTTLAKFNNSVADKTLRDLRGIFYYLI